MIDPRTMAATEIIFTHIDADDGTVRTFAVTRMIAECEKFSPPVVTIPIDPKFAEYCLERRGIEQHRLDAMSLEDLDKPIIIVETNKDTFLIVDGHHRYVKRWQGRFTMIRAHVYRLGAYNKFLVYTGDFADRVTPEMLQSMYSGIRRN